MIKNHFSNTLLIAFMMLFSCSIVAQKFSKIDKSPLDIALYQTSRKATPIIKTVYSRPMKNGRTIFGDLIPYGKVWRTGANECSEITFNKAVKIGGNTIKPGTYALFTIPGEKEWTIILNSHTDQWGAHGYDKSKDVARIKVSVGKTASQEAFSIAYTKTDNGVNMFMAWDTTLVSIPVVF
jgi:hypothetical protein